MSATPIVAIVGPTAVGKSELALLLAEALDGEIVSADSRQVYRHLDIGTAKPSASERARVRHHLLDVVDPDVPFDAATYRTHALAAIRDIVGRGRRPIVCGGTGLYVRALLRGLFRGPPAAPALRQALYDREVREGAGTLHRRLAECDPVTAARLHPRDLVRIVRALEVRALTGRPISAWQDEHGFGDTRLAALVLGCARPRAELAVRIAARCDAMLAGGLVEEIGALAACGWGPALAPLRSVGYRELGAHLRGACDLAAARAAFVRATCRLAKRQMTWFRAEPAVRWIHPERERADALALARDWLTPAWPSPTSSSSAPSPR